MNKEESVLQGRLRMLGIIEKIMKGRVCFIGKMRDGVYCREDKG